MKIPKPRKLPSGTWFVQMRLNGESISVSAKAKKECINQAQFIKAEYKAGKREPKHESKPDVQKIPTLGEAIDDYMAKRDAVLSPSTLRGYQSIRRSRFKSVMQTPISDIADSDWQSICNKEAKLCSSKTLKNAWGLVSSVLYEATGKEPPRVKLPQVVSAERKFLEPEQIRPFIEAVKGTPVEISALLALSSLRRSEILGLRWENVNLKKKTIKVKGAMVYNPYNHLTEKKENKNRSSARIVPIMIDELYSALSAAKESTGNVVHLAPNTIQRNIDRVCKENGLPTVGIHGLRHSFVSLAYHLGVPEKIVMEIGGWSDYQTMRKIYTHIAQSDISRYTDQFKGFFSET